MNIKRYVFNPLNENTYILHGNTNHAIIVDPGNSNNTEDAQVFEYLDGNTLNDITILLTHAHIDHIAGINSLVKKYPNTKVALHKIDYETYKMQKVTASMFEFKALIINDINIWLDEITTVNVGEITLKIIFTPGHAPGHIAFYHVETASLFSGDVLFLNGIGRTDLPGGDYDTLINTIKNKVYNLPENTTVYCGHGEETSIKYEKETNPFVKG